MYFNISYEKKLYLDEGAKKSETTGGAMKGRIHRCDIVRTIICEVRVTET